MITATFTLGNDFLIWDRLSNALNTGISITNIGDTLLLWAAAFLAGMSIGAMLLNQLVFRYKYQLELLELATRMRADPENEPDHFSSRVALPALPAFTVSQANAGMDLESPDNHLRTTAWPEDPFVRDDVAAAGRACITWGKASTA